MSYKMLLAGGLMLLGQSCSLTYENIEEMRVVTSAPKDGENLTKIVKELNTEKMQLQSRLYALDIGPFISERLDRNPLDIEKSKQLRNDLTSAFKFNAQTDFVSKPKDLEKARLDQNAANEAIFKLSLKGLSKITSTNTIDTLLQILNDKKDLTGPRPQYILDATISHIDDFQQAGRNEDLVQAILLFELALPTLDPLVQKQLNFIKSKTVALPLLTILLKRSHDAKNEVLLSAVIAENTRFIKQLILKPKENPFDSNNLKLAIDALAKVGCDFQSSGRTLANDAVKYFAPAIYLNHVVDFPSKSLDQRLDSYRECMKLFPDIDRSLAESNPDTNILFCDDTKSKERHFNTQLFADTNSYEKYRKTFFEQLWNDLPNVSLGHQKTIHHYLFNQEPERLFQFLERTPDDKLPLPEAILEATLLGLLSRSEKLDAQQQLQAGMTCAALIDKNYGMQDFSKLVQIVDQLLFEQQPILTLAQIQGLIHNARIIPNKTLITATGIFVSRLKNVKLESNQKELFEKTLASTFTLKDYSAARIATAYLLEHNPNLLVNLLSDKIADKSEYSVDLLILEETLTKSSDVSLPNRTRAINEMLERFKGYAAEEEQNHMACTLFRITKNDALSQEKVKELVIEKRPEFLKIYDSLTKVTK